MQTSLLLCDDMPEIREFLRKELDRHPDLQVIGEACDGLEAVELAGRLHPDLVVLDLEMPVMGGAEALSAILEQDPSVAVVILTGLEDSALEVDLLARGASAFIRKGVSLTEIIQTIRQVTGTEDEMTSGLDRVGTSTKTAVA